MRVVNDVRFDIIILNIGKHCRLKKNLVNFGIN